MPTTSGSVGTESKNLQKRQSPKKKSASSSQAEAQVVSKSKKTGSAKGSAFGKLSEDLIKNMFTLMMKSRVLEERLIKIYKSGNAFFWIGAPGEEAFGVPLGLLTNKGQGVNYDYLHLHYRGTPTLVAMGMPMLDSIRLIMNKVTDPNTGGRNFSNHYCIPEWNVAPVTSPIEVQYSFAIGTALAQRHSKDMGISIVTGGDAGTAEGDFASSLIWASRPEMQLPILLTVQNNRWGISTSYDTQHGEKFIADRGKAFGIRTRVMNGNDPVESYLALKEEMDYIRNERKPVLLEARVSRLYGHSSASGANFVGNEEDCIESFAKKLIQEGVFSEKEIKMMREEFELEAKQAADQARTEAFPSEDSIWDHTYADNENADWRKF